MADKFQSFYDDDSMLKMARNHISLFRKVVSKDFLKNLERVESYTMLSIERLYDLYLTVNYLNSADIEGDFMEIGTWKGGALGMALLSDKTNTRNVIGFDTFEGHNKPGVDEFDVRGQNMQKRWEENNSSGLKWAQADFTACKAFLEELSSNSPNRVNLIKGDIKLTSENFIPRKLAILRIDCDWYPESLVSLKVFWPNLVSGGFLILDDYGHHSGQKKAFEEYFKNQPQKITHVDYSCITIQKK